jgi:hypothetical protein
MMPIVLERVNTRNAGCGRTEEAFFKAKSLFQNVPVTREPFDAQDKRKLHA